MTQPSPNHRAYRLLAGGKRRTAPQVEAPPPAPPQNQEVVQALLQMQVELIRGFTALQTYLQSGRSQNDPQIAHLAELARNLLARDERRELAQRDLVHQQGQLRQQLAALEQKRIELEQHLSAFQEDNAQLQQSLHLEEIKRIELLAALRLAKEKVRTINNNLQNTHRETNS